MESLAGKSFYIDARTAASVAHAEMALIRVEDRIRSSAYCQAITELCLWLEASTIVCDGSLGTFLKRRFEGERQTKTICSFESCEGVKKWHRAFSYGHTLHWIAQRISPNSQINPEALLDIYSRCAHGKGHHQTNVRFRRKDDAFLADSDVSLTPDVRQENAFPLVLDLCEFINRNVYSPLTQAAIAYYHYMRIMPFDEVDTKTVTSLSHAILLRRGLLRKTVTPFSLLSKIEPKTVNIERFVSNKRQCAHGEAEATQELNAWISLCAGSAEFAASAMNALCDTVETLESGWREQLGRLNRGSVLELILHELPLSPVITVEAMMESTERSFTTVNDAITRLVDSEILSITDRAKQGTRVFCAKTALYAYDRLVSTIMPPFLLSAAFRSQLYN